MAQWNGETIPIQCRNNSWCGRSRRVWFVESAFWVSEDWEWYRFYYGWKVLAFSAQVQIIVIEKPNWPLLVFFRLFKVNGQPIFIRGGNWILSDGLLRLSKKRYKTDIKFHADMNFNMIRCWGGGLAERPEFYHYCDIYGLLVSFSLPP